MRLIMGTKHYNYLVRLGLPFPPEEAIDTHIMSMESEIEKEGSCMEEGNYFSFRCGIIQSSLNAIGRCTVNISCKY